jgi:SAM-dependent methyltransferase
VLEGQYNSQPIAEIDGIPVFSASDCYTVNYENIATDHLRHFEKTGHNPFMDEAHWNEIENSTAALIRKYIEPGNKILDVGVGMGRLLKKFPELDRYGMDISMKYLKHSKNAGINVCMSKIEDMPYKENYFDIITSTDVLEHVLDLNLAFTRILKVLKPGGVLICRVPYREDLSGYLAPNQPYDFVHLRNFDEYSIRILVEIIFKMNFVEWGLCGYAGGRIKYNSSIKKINSIIVRLLKMTKHFGDNFHMRICKRFRYPSEINFVVRKVDGEINTQSAGNPVK